MTTGGMACNMPAKAASHSTLLATTTLQEVTGNLLQAFFCEALQQ